MKYWVFKHGNDDYAKDIIDKALENNFCMCQYEYEFQDNGTVTRIWNLLKEIKEGDLIILGAYGNKYKYAWGYAIKPRFEKNLEKVQLNCEEVINTRHNNFQYRSDNYNGYIEFNDCECFYENLEDGESGWGQRIDIDQWRNIERDSIEYIHEYKLALNTIHEISKKDALNIVRLLKYEPNFTFKEDIMEDYKKLLENNYNLILTGAPGTGKTYLAKQIAAKIIFNDDKKEYTEELEENEDFKNQCQFVQFHPSYDYTDFVEGLRPIKDSNGKIGFERKDGVFKEFCKKALKNLINIELITIKEYLITFANEMYNDFKKDNKITLKGISGKSVAPFTNIEFDEKKEILSMKAESQSEYTISGNINEYVDWYKLYKKFQQNETSIKGMMEDKIPKFKGKGSYLCAILNNFYEKYNSAIEEEVNNKKKNFVFIIDEINRGEISKIFGELFFAIDPGYRGESGKVQTQYNNLINNDESDEDDEFEDGFFVPENVYIIGTMNDIDRSVESMDFAMRRRFAWKEIKAEDTQDMLDSMFDDNTAITNKDDIIKEAKGRMDNLNKEIEQIESFNSSYHIGASYFLKLKNYYNGGNIEEAFNSLWENHLRGLLYEYLRGMPDAESKLEELKNAYNSGYASNTQTPNNQQSSIDTEKVNDGE